MPKGLEVELELLGVKGISSSLKLSRLVDMILGVSIESVELLAAVAEIDADQTPPCCLEIAQLCGRLPVGLLVCFVMTTDEVCMAALLEYSRKFNPDLR